MQVKVVTYATHSYGTFEDITNNKVGIDVDVLGWGQKWNGFMDKFKGVRKYIDNLNNDDIVIFLDGFDSEILRPLDEAIERFKSMDCKILISQVPKYQRSGILRYFTCKNHFNEKLNDLLKNNNTEIANSGLYMGYVKELKILFDKILNNHSKCKDDQRELNIARKDFDFIKIDKEDYVFSNDNNMDACFIQNPGKISFNRVFRGIREYSQFFLLELIILSIILTIIFRKKHIAILLFYYSLIILLFIYMDKSCI